MINHNNSPENVPLPCPDASELLKKPYLTEKEVSIVTGRSIYTLRNERHLRRGFPYLKISDRAVRYLSRDIRERMEARRISFDS